MIYINFVYKNSVVHTEKVYIPHTQDNVFRVTNQVKRGVIKAPENYDKLSITEFEMTDREKLFL